MKFLQRIFGSDVTEEKPDEPKPEKYHCIRFMTERGEQIGMLLTQDEFERGVTRWVQTIKTMPIQESPDDDEGVL